MFCKETNFVLKAGVSDNLKLENSLHCEMGDAKTFLLNQFFSLDYTCENLHEALHNATTGWKLDKRHLVAITTKTGSNVISAIKLNMQRFTPTALCY